MKNSDDFKYVTLDFFRPSERNKILSKLIQIISFHENDKSEKIMKNVNDEAVKIDKNDEKLKNPQSRDQNLELIKNFENLRINQSIEQIEIVSTTSTLSNQTNRSFKNISCCDYVKLNDFEYKSRNCDNRDCDANAIKKVIEISTL